MRLTRYTRRVGSLSAIRTKRFLLATLLFLPSLSACSGVGRSNPAVLPQSASAPLAPDAAVREAQSDSALSPAAPYVAGPNDLLYVANAGSNSITVYHTGASGNTAPLATIAGANTQLDSPGPLSEDANGDLYVANDHFILPASILVFKHGANGNVAPLRVITGPLTGLSTNYLEAVTVDQTTGKIFAMLGTQNGGGASELVRFPPNASGNQAPLATTVNGLFSALELASDSTGHNIIEASDGECCNSATFGVYTFAKQFPNGANPTSIYAVNSFDAVGVADDPTTKTYLASGTDGVSSGIFRFDEDTVGHGVPPFGGSPNYTPPVVSLITSDTCGRQLALGYQRSIYVAHNASLGCSTDAVYVYRHDASGSVAPLRILTGSATKLDQPTGIYEGK
jgi:hypothetical protein